MNEENGRMNQSAQVVKESDLSRIVNQFESRLAETQGLTQRAENYLMKIKDFPPNPQEQINKTERSGYLGRILDLLDGLTEQNNQLVMINGWLDEIIG